MHEQDQARNWLHRRALLGGLSAAAAVPAAAVPAAARSRIRVGGTGAAVGGLESLGAALQQEGSGPGVEVVRNLGTEGGIRALVAGAIDLGLSARPITPQESERGLVACSYATTSLVFATHPGTVTDVITLDLAAAIIAGVVRAWPNGTRVRVSRRPSRDSDTQLLAGLSPAMRAAVATLQDRPGLPTAISDHDQAKVLGETPGSFGVLALSLIASEARAIKVLGVEGHDPHGPDWPMQKTLYAIRRADVDPAVVQVFDRLRTPWAHALLAGLGHLPPKAGG